MNEIDVMIATCRHFRERTLGLLAKIEALTDPQAALGWRPGPGRAHLAWQFMHIGVTEELFATERLKIGAKAGFGDLIGRFRGGSTPDDSIPPAPLIREVLSGARAHLETTLAALSPDQLDVVPEPLKERNWTLRTALQVLAWHEAHHQGQCHLTLNLYKAHHPQA